MRIKSVSDVGLASCSRGATVRCIIKALGRTWQALNSRTLGRCAVSRSR